VTEPSETTNAHRLALVRASTPSSILITLQRVHHFPNLVQRPLVGRSCAALMPATSDLKLS
jgi:hypothetical protein